VSGGKAPPEAPAAFSRHRTGRKEQGGSHKCASLIWLLDQTNKPLWLFVCLLNACFENKPMKEPALPIVYMFFFFFPL